jgi:hypothetical protein
MIRLLQRMDDTEPRHPVPGEASCVPPAGLHRLTLLADADESEVEAVEDWARGLDWVQWLFSSVRQRMTALHFKPSAPERTQAVLRLEWQTFANAALLSIHGPHLVAAWHGAGSAATLIDLDRAYGAGLSEEQSESSREAGRLLLKSTRGARYQGALGHLRSAVEAGQTAGHFLTVWAAVAHFFQLGLANVIAEYLRLEWALAVRHLPVSPTLNDLPELTARLMQERQHELRVVA